MTARPHVPPPGAPGASPTAAPSITERSVTERGINRALHDPTNEQLVGSELHPDGTVVLLFQFPLPPRKRDLALRGVRRRASQRERFGRGYHDLSRAPKPLPPIEGEYAELVAAVGKMRVKPRHVSAVLYAAAHGYVTSEVFSSLAHLRPTAARKDLRLLAAKGLLSRRGSGKGTYYELGEHLPSVASTPPRDPSAPSPLVPTTESGPALRGPVPPEPLL